CPRTPRRAGRGRRTNAASIDGGRGQAPHKRDAPSGDFSPMQDPDEQPFEPLDRQQFLNLAGLFEGGLVAVAAVLAWWAGIDPRNAFEWKWNGVAWGCAATVPTFLLFLVTFAYPMGPLRTMKQ